MITLSEAAQARTTMTANRNLLLGVVLACLAALPAQAQDQNDGGGDDMSSADALLDATLGCIAAYDAVLARDSRDQPAAESRRTALGLYADLSGESDEDITADIRQADASLPQWLAEDGDTLDDMRAGCDDAFMEETGGDDLPRQTI